MSAPTGEGVSCIPCSYFQLHPSQAWIGAFAEGWADLGTVKCELMYGQGKNGSSGICYAMNSQGFGKMSFL